MTTKRDLKGQAARLGSTTGYDRILDASLDGVSALVPFAGPLVAGLLRQVAPRDDQTYLADFAQDAAAAIDELDATKIDRTYFDSEEWAEDAGRVFESVAQIRNRRKREHFVAALANAAPLDRPGEQERHRFFDLLDALRPSHFRLLGAILTAQSTRGDGSFDDWARRRLDDLDVENVRLDWLDLQQAGFLAAIPSGMATTSLEERIAATLPPIAHRFVAFVEAEPTVDADPDE